VPSQSQLIDEYAAGPQTLRKAVAGMTREQLRARPVPGKWSTLEVVCHLCDFDAIYADRMKRITAEDRPEIRGADQERYAGTLAYQERDIDEELALIDQTRKHMARILRTLSPDAFSRTATHRESAGAEARTLEHYLMLIISHIPHHVKFIQDKRRALGVPAPAG
jgi:uncharacterized damage-inducible protein DinB